MENIEVMRPIVHHDQRGWLAEILRREHLGGAGLFGQILITAVLPGVVKGNHYHTRKTEWFLVVKGSGEIMTKHVRTGSSQRILVNETPPVVVRISPYVAHAIRNKCEQVMHTIVYCDEPFRSEDPDTYPERVIEP